MMFGYEVQPIVHMYLTLEQKLSIDSE